ncbi:MAG: NUDIX domain-containing protein [Candidatus Heimdallarchaeaceae archaeon]|jgi:ADP-ribose pyrophosphatase YjhB (NUDIX family)
MNSNILNIVVTGIRWNTKWLLIKRRRGDYRTKWALVGGKIEHNEEIKESILREIREETSLNVVWEGVKGIINERLVEKEKGNITRHFIIILCQVRADSNEIAYTDEGELRWFSIEEINNHRKEIIPSDYYMLTEILQKQISKQLVEVEMIQEGDELILSKLHEY